MNKVKGKIKKEEKKQTKIYNSEMQLINLSDIRLGYNPRSSLGDLTSLKQSIQQIGLLEPVILRPNKQKDDNRPYEIVCGHRRYKAFDELKYLQIPARILKLSDEESESLSFIDNKERKNYNPVDEARHYRHMQEKYGEDKYSTRNLAKIYGEEQSREYYARKLRLLELPDEVAHRCATNEISETHCIPVCKLMNKDKLQKKFEELFATKFDDWDEKQIERFNQEILHRQQVQIDLSKKIIKNDWSVKQAENQAKKLLDELKKRNENLDKEIEKKKKEITLLDDIHFKSSWKMEELKNDSVPLIVTSPDYWGNKEYGKYKDFGEYKTNLRNIFKECKRVLCPGGRLCINVNDILNLNNEGIYLIGCFIQSIFKNSNVKLIDKIIWKKDVLWDDNPYVKFEGMEGNYRTLPSTEYIFIFKKDGKRELPASIKIKGGLTKEEWITYSSGLWDIPSVHINKNAEEKDHLSKFPEEIIRRLIKMFSFPGESVLDPCLGSGTTVKVAREEQRIGIGYEWNKERESIIIEQLKGD